ncbi:hypothetical protein NQ314_010662 [Rhamnusium bicolor]|uniref:Uncharacterized protein n=1 Tax=Rhamnusium bicolor TaxID=1586634 RepID=A0AAV8XNR3_9CUCU|nr:hypothetical protein NQ314_010662 [Rhamnusium bicolor]
MENIKLAIESTPILFYQKMDFKKKACVAIIIALTMKRHVKRRYWMKKWLKKRENYSHLMLLKEISDTNEVGDYKNYFRMDEETFNKLLRMVEPILIRKNTVMRSSLPVNERLAFNSEIPSHWKKL